jgi:toxin ParE1/3/4
MKIVWAAQALQDLMLVREHIKKDNESAAARVARRLRVAAKQLATHSEIGRPGRVGSTRELVVSGTPYILPYRIRHDSVEILAVLHGAQEWPNDFS